MTLSLTPDQARMLADPAADVDRAEFVAHNVKGRLIYVPGPEWFAWSGTHWENDGTPGQAVARGMVHTVSNELLALAQRDSRTEYIDAARALRTSRNINNVLTELKALADIRHTVEELDADPYALTFTNGTVDLRTGELHTHKPSDLITSVVAYRLNPDADASRWIGYLKASQPNAPDMWTFLQRLAGYGLTGSTKEEALAFFYGSGRNGKGVFTETLENIFRPITTTQNGDFWEKGKYGRKGSLVGKLHGARMVFSSEMTAARLDEAFVKAFTAADSMTADPKHKPAYDFTPTGLLIMSGNDKPTIRGTDDGIWARFRCVPWDESFIGREDRTLKEDLKSPAHAEGVIAWAVAGAAEWYREGLNTPERVSKATEEYREESNPFADWASESFEHDPDGFVSNAEIKERGEKVHPRLPGSPQSWGAAIAKHFRTATGTRRVNGKKTRGVIGVKRSRTDIFGQSQ